MLLNAESSGQNIKKRVKTIYLCHPHSLKLFQGISNKLFSSCPREKSDCTTSKKKEEFWRDIK